MAVVGNTLCVDCGIAVPPHEVLFTEYGEVCARCETRQYVSKHGVETYEEGSYLTLDLGAFSLSIPLTGVLGALIKGVFGVVFAIAAVVFGSTFLMGMWMKFMG